MSFDYSKSKSIILSKDSCIRFKYVMLLDMYTAMVYSNATVGVFLGYAVAVFVGFLRIQLRSSSIQR